jgi:hypothetical protein
LTPRTSTTKPDRYGLARNSPCFIPRKNGMIEKTIIEGRTIVKTVEGVITDVSRTVEMATITTSGTTERTKSNSISVVVFGQTKLLR